MKKNRIETLLIFGSGCTRAHENLQKETGPQVTKKSRAFLFEVPSPILRG